MNRLQYLLLIFLVVLLNGCKSTSPEIDRGNDYEFKIGHPELRISAIGMIDEEDNSVIKVATEVVYSSMIHKFNDGKRISDIKIEYLIIETTTGYSESLTKNFTMESTPSKVEGESFTIQENFIVVPGEYDINVTVTDLSSDKESTRQITTFIPDPENPTINITSIQLSAKDTKRTEEGFFPITTYDVPERMDSLRFFFQVTNNDAQNPLTIKSKFIRFNADTTASRPMNYRDYPVSSIQYKGIEMGNTEVLVSGTRILNQSGSVYIEFLYPSFDKGNYRFEVELIKDGDSKTIKARDFSIKSLNYPAIKHVTEFAAPLYYLMDTKEYQKLIFITDEKELKDAIDRFWLSNIDNANKARSVIELYYDRVEEANKLFSTYKEGWKTDLGMMYILFGQPWYTDQDLNQLSWSYTFNPQDPNKNFYFYSPNLNNRFYPFDNYILRRSSNYYEIYYQQINLWLSGNILISNL